jgi:GNAT superfamily N-acetyltransferase
VTVGEAFLVSNSSRKASLVPYTALWGLSAPYITPRKGMEQMNQKARQPGFMHASLLQFFAEGVDPFLRVKAAAEFELNKANKKHDAVIEEAERPLTSVKDAARAEYNEHYGKIKQIRDAAQKKLDPHGEVRLESYKKADDEFSPHEDRIEGKRKEAYEEYKPHEKAHENKIDNLRNEYYTEANKHSSRLRDAIDAHFPSGGTKESEYQESVGQAHQDFDDYKVKHDKALDDANAELEPHKKAYNARHEALLAELQPHKDKRDAAYAAAEDVFAPHRQEYKRTMETTENSLDEARKVWSNKVKVAQQEHEDSGRDKVISREQKKRDATLSRFHTQMQNAPHPRNVEYEYHYETRHGEDDMHEVSVHHNGEEVGHIRWANENHDEDGNYHRGRDDYYCSHCGDSFDNYHHNEDHEQVCPSCNEKDTVYENDDWDTEGSGYRPGEIGYIHVKPAYQRHGIATNLVKKAREFYESGDATTRAEHSDNKTSEGRAWHQHMVEKDPKMASLLQHFVSEEDPFLTIKKQEDARLQNAIDKHEDEAEKNTSPNAAEQLQQKINEANKIYKKNMNNAPHPQNVEYHWMGAGGGYGHQITAHHSGKQIGRMEWTPQEKVKYTGNHFPGEIQWIEVDEPYQSHGIATTMLQKAHEVYQAGLADSKPEHSDIKTDEGQAWHDHLIHNLHPHASKNATVLNDKRPNQRLFAPTLTNLDPRLFDGERLRPEIRETIMNRIAAHWDGNYKNWREWSRVYLAGSAVSHWWADYNAVSHAGEPGLDYHLNDDLDTLIGIEYGGLLENHPEFLGVPAKVISAELNKGLRENCNLDDIFFEVPSAEVPEWEWADTPQNGKVKVGPWSATFYVNPNSYDIRIIKPYAAYDLTNDEWAVKPVEAAEGHNFTPTEWYYFEGVAAEVMATLQLPEPARSNKAKHLWEFIHTNRNKAFRPDGQGVFDYRNVVEKYLDQLGLWQPLVNARFKVQSNMQDSYRTAGSRFYGGGYV